MSTSTRAFMSPRHYWQGPGELDRLGERVAHLGRRAVVVLSERARNDLGARIVRAAEPLEVELLTTTSTCTFAAVDAVAEALRDRAADIVVAVGGGTIIDTVKAAASRVGSRIAVVPTLASTDAPTAAAAVIYGEDGSVASIETYPEGPDSVIVDTDLIRDAPSRYLVAGMGDALATTYEARAAAAAGARVLAGGVGTAAARAIAEQCRVTLFAEAERALAFAAGSAPERAPFEAVVEANILLSGLGFESGGLAGAHAVHNGLKPFASAGALHGELVAYGLLVHLTLLGESEQCAEVRAFNRAVGLPVSAVEAGVRLDDAQVLTRVAERACDRVDSMRNMPREIGADDVVRAIEAVEREARR